MHIGVIGINHKLADLKLRESFAKACQRSLGSSPYPSNLHNNFLKPDSFVLLSTCNRTEIYFSSKDLIYTHGSLLSLFRSDLDAHCEGFDQKLYSYFGLDCFKHLARVTAGLDSAVVAETEIQGQVKQAYEKTIAAFFLPNDMHFLFQKALKIGKWIRSELFLGKGVPDVEHAVLNAGFHFFDCPEEAEILFIGASEINRKILAHFKAKRCKNITLCNRSSEPVHEICQKYGIKSLEWSQMKAWPAFDWVILGTKASEYLIAKPDLSKSPASDKLIIDLSVPRNVDPRLGKDGAITLLNIDQINRMLKFRRKRMSRHLIQAEELVHAATKRQIQLFYAKQEKKEEFLAVG